MEFQLDIVKEQGLIRSDDRELKKKLQNYVQSSKLDQLPRISNRILLKKEPIIHHKDVSLLFANTCYRLFPKSEIQKAEYLRMRKFSLLLYNFLIQRMNYAHAAMTTIEIISEELSSFDEIDLFIEFIFDPKLLPFQAKLFAYFIISQTNKSRFHSLKEGNTHIEDLPNEVDLTDVAFNRHRYLSNDPSYVRVAHNNYIIDVPIALLPQIPQPQIVHLGYRKVGTTDKALDNKLIRNALHDLFPVVPHQPQYYIMNQATSQRSSDTNIVQNAITLEFPKDQSISKVSIYQIMNTYLPLREGKKSLDINSLLFKSHKIGVYGSNFLIKFNPSRLTDTFPDYKFDNEVGIYELPINQLPVLYRNLKIFAEHLSHSFIMPEVVLDYYTLEISSPELQPLFDYYNNRYGGEFTYLNLTHIEQEVYENVPDEDAITVILRQIRNAIQMRLIYKSPFIKKHLSGLFKNIENIEYLLKSVGISKFIELLIGFSFDQLLKEQIIAYLQSQQHELRRNVA